jgi:hypothetical protein
VDPTEAQEHLALIEKIIDLNDREFYIAGDLFLAWGASGALIDLLIQLTLMGRVPSWTLWFGFGALILSGIYNAVRIRQFRRNSERMSIRQREFLNVLWVTVGVTLVAACGGFRIFDYWAAGALWTLSAAIVTLYAGLHGNRAGMIGGVILVASLVAANFMPGFEGFVLAAGMLAGYAGFGVATMLARD